MRSWLTIVVVAPLVLAVLACDAERADRSRALKEAQRYTTRDLIQPQRHGGTYTGGMATGDTADGAVFARWVLDQDPQRRYLTDAVVRNEQTLGVKVQPTITKGELQRLLPALAEGMARAFPSKPLVVNAFEQSGDKLAEAVYNPRTAHTDVRVASWDADADTTLTRDGRRNT
jgi:hypothetical protein